LVGAPGTLLDGAPFFVIPLETAYAAVAIADATAAYLAGKTPAIADAREAMSTRTVTQNSVVLNPALTISDTYTSKDSLEHAGRENTCEVCDTVLNVLAHFDSASMTRKERDSSGNHYT
jgi:hypothetical protein